MICERPRQKHLVGGLRPTPHRRPLDTRASTLHFRHYINATSIVARALDALPQPEAFAHALTPPERALQSPQQEIHIVSKQRPTKAAENPTSATDRKAIAANVTVKLEIRGKEVGQGILVPGGFILTAAACTERQAKGPAYVAQILTTARGRRLQAVPYAVDPVEQRRGSR